MQDLKHENEIELEKVEGVNNPADLMTKLNHAPLLEEHCRKLGLTHEEGRASKASQLSRGII